MIEQSMTHLTEEVVGLWAMGLLEPLEADAVQNHALRCESCAALLATESRLQIALETQPPKPVTRPSR